MTWKAVKSTNPLKRRIVMAIKEKTGITRAKITNVKENEDSVCGDVMTFNGTTYDKVGTITITKMELNFIWPEWRKR